MKKTLWALCGAAAATLFLTLAQAAAQDDPDAPRGGITTLYALDPLTHSFCFGDGRPGTVMQGGEVRNRCSDIDFGNYAPDGLTVAIEGARLGAIVDLGSPADHGRRYGLSGPIGQSFVSLSFEGGRLRVLKDHRARTMQELPESDLLLREGSNNASVPVRLGSIYFVRLTDRQDRTFQRLVKLQVIAHTPNQSVTIRWQRL